MATLNQAAQLIATSGSSITYFLQGEPGIGKSSILKMLETNLGSTYDYIYADCPLMDLPDFAMPMVDQKTRTTHFAPSSLWQFASTKPKVIMLDEVSKAPNVVKPMFTRLMLERCIGEFNLPEGSIVFATGNNASDGVGDTMQGHINNRVTRIGVAKPTAEAWIDWGISAGVNEIVLAAVHQFPHVMQSYLDDGGADNPYIFNPKRNTGAFASPRSLYKAGFICDSREKYGADLTHEALQGTIGVSFAGDMMAYMAVADSVPSWEAIKAKPTKTPVPDSPAAQLLLVFGSISQVTTENAKAFTEYFFRFPLEVRMLWARQFKNRLQTVMGVKQFRDVLVEDSWVFGG